MKKRLCLLLVLAILLAGCGGTTAETTETVETPTVTETVPAETEPEEVYLEAEDFGGRTFGIFCSKPAGQNFPYEEVLATEETGEVLNDAILQRNRWLEEKYNIVVEAIQGNHPGDASSRIKTDVTAGDTAYDIAFGAPVNLFQSALNGHLYQMDKLPYVDSTNDWWLHYVNEAASVNHIQYILGGDMNIGMFNGCSVMYFNKTVQDRYQIEDLYDLVKAGKWTVDKLQEISEIVLTDVDGNGVYDGSDLLGFRGNTYTFQMLYYGYGEEGMIVKKDADDIPYLDITENNVEKIIRVIELLNYDPYIQHPNFEEVSFPAFMNDLGLFMTNPAYQLSQMRDMESDFGMLPEPKWNEAQEAYFSQVHTGWSTITAVPITLQEADMEFVGKITEDMAHISNQLVRPAYYEIMLNGKYTRDEESADMMDYIFGNIIIDIAYLITGYQGFDFDTITRNATDAGDTNMASKLASVKEKYETAIAAVIENWGGSQK